MRRFQNTLTAAVTAAALILAGPVGASNLPSLGDPSSMVLSPDRERQMAEAFLRYLHRQQTVLDDPLAQEYLDTLGRRLAVHSSGSGFRFLLIGDPTLNAFAGPGQIIGVHTGLIRQAESESELASVLAHEIAHVTQNHLARTIADSQRFSIPTAAALLAAVLLGSQGVEVGQAALTAATAGAAQHRLNFSRANEQEADRVGLHILARAGFDPEAMAAFFERMERMHRYYGNRIPEFLSTHPVTASRIADTRARAADYPAIDSRNSLEFRLIQARLAVLEAGTADEALVDFKARHAADPTDPAARYGLAYAHLQKGQAPAAVDILNELHEAAPDVVPYVVTLSRALAAQGEDQAALDTLSAAQRRHPDNRALTLTRAVLLLETGRPAPARQLMEERLRRWPDDAEAHRLMARAATEQGDRAAAHQAMAEHYYLSGRLHAAVHQLTLAQRVPELSTYQRARMEARLKELKRLAQEEAES